MARENENGLEGKTEMISENGKSRWQIAKTIVEYTAKSLITLASPPIGIAMLIKSPIPQVRIASVLVGLVASGMIGGMIDFEFRRKVLLRSPETVVKPVATGRSWVSPLWHLMTENVSTSIKGSKRSVKYEMIGRVLKDSVAQDRTIQGRPIQLNPDDGLYELDFDEDMKFSIKTRSDYFGHSLRGYRLSDSKEALQEALQRGDIEVIEEARVDLERVQSRYDETRAVFENVVGKMNEERYTKE